MDIIVLCHNIFTYCDCTIHNLGLIILTHAHIYHRLEKKIRGDLSTKHVGSRGPHRIACINHIQSFLGGFLYYTLPFNMGHQKNINLPFAALLVMSGI